MKRLIDIELDELCTVDGPDGFASTLDQTVRPVDRGHRVVPAPTLEELDGEEDV